MEQYIGRKLTKDEIVHHINGIKNDNRIENLQIMTRTEHIYLHKKQGDIPCIMTEERKRHLSGLWKGKRRGEDNVSSKKVMQLDLNGNFIKTFNSVREAGRYLGDERKNTHIVDVCLGKRQIAYGYKWQYCK